MSDINLNKSDQEKFFEIIDKFANTNQSKSEFLAELYKLLNNGKELVVKKNTPKKNKKRTKEVEGSYIIDLEDEMFPIVVKIEELLPDNKVRVLSLEHSERTEYIVDAKDLMPCK